MKGWWLKNISGAELGGAMDKAAGGDAVDSQQEKDLAACRGCTPLTLVNESQRPREANETTNS